MGRGAQDEAWQRKAKQKWQADEKQVFAVSMRQNQMAFATAVGWCEANDAESGGGLDFGAFTAMVREQLRMQDISEARVKAWFDACDVNGDGCIDAVEFFRFSVLSARQQSDNVAVQKGKKEGRAVSEMLLEAYDTSGDGQVDRQEFGRMATKLGFGDEADK